jgi:hypothetical protein
MKRPRPTWGCRVGEKKLFTTQPPGYIFSDQRTNEGKTRMSLIIDFTQHTIQKKLEAKCQNSWLEI